MGDSLGNYAGNKYYPMAPLYLDSFADLLGITAAQAAKLKDVCAFSGIDKTSGEKRVVYFATYVDTGAIDLTVYGAMDIGSELLVLDSGTYRIAKKVARSSTAVIGDWYYVNLTVVS